MRIIISSLFVFFLTLSHQLFAMEVVLEPKGAWVRSTIETQRSTAMYLSLRNTTKKVIELVGVESDIADHATFHTTIEKDGVAKMRHKSSILVKPGKKVIFKQGGLHVMLMGLKSKIEVGDYVTVNFKTKSGEVIPVKAMARSAPCPNGCCDP